MHRDGVRVAAFGFAEEPERADDLLARADRSELHRPAALDAELALCRHVDDPPADQLQVLLAVATLRGVKAESQETTFPTH